MPPPGHTPANFVMPDAGGRLDIVALRTGARAQRQKILADNPHRIYDFEPAPG